MGSSADPAAVAREASSVVADAERWNAVVLAVLSEPEDELRGEAVRSVGLGPPGQPWPRWLRPVRLFLGFPPFLALVKTVALANYFQNSNVVCETVQQCPPLFFFRCPVAEWA